MNSSCDLCHVAINSLSVKSGKKILLDNINLDIHCGELTSVIGPNGAGKTTLINAILGELPFSGSIDFFNHDGKPTTPKIGYVPQHLNFDISAPISVLDFLTAVKFKTPVFFGHSKKAVIAAHAMLKKVDCTHVLNSKLGEISGGELQRVLLATALDKDTNLLILDEPVSGVDEAGLSMFYNKVSSLRKNLHLSIILITHDLHMAKTYSDKIVLLNKNILAYGSPDEVFENSEFNRIFKAG